MERDQSSDLLKFWGLVLRLKEVKLGPYLLQIRHFMAGAIIFLSCGFFLSFFFLA